METNLEELPPQQTVALEPKSVNRTLFIVVSVIAVLSAIGVSVLYPSYANLHKQYNEQTAKLNALSLNVTEITKKVTAQEGNSDKIAKITEQTDNLKKLAIFTAIQHDIEGGVVTDDFVVARIDLTTGDNGNLIAGIDLDTQPGMAMYYQGKGSFSLSDRELRAKSEAIIKTVKDRYQNIVPDGLPQWDDSANVNLTIKNYNIGSVTTADGLKLVGEK